MHYFRGHDETEKSNNKGLFIEVLSLIREDNEKIFKVTLENSPKNEKLTSPTIQKDILMSLVMFLEKQMAIVLRYVDKLGIVKERFIGVVHVLDTSSLSLKAAIDTVRGQGYDGASNMSGAFNGLKSLILNENSFAHYIHCFAHQLQLVVVTVAKKHDDVDEFFEQLGRGLNQEISLIRAGDTRWDSHFITIVSLLNLFAEVVAVLKYVKDERSTLSNRNQAKSILSYFKTLDFVFLTLDVGKSMPYRYFVKASSKKRSRYFGSGFVSKRDKESIHNIRIVDMSEYYVTPRKRRTNKTNQHHFEVVIFNTVLDMQIQEFGDRFSEVGTDLIENMAALSPCDSFSSFDKAKLLKLSEIYKNDFNDSERAQLNGQLDIYYHSLLDDEKFFNLKGIADLSRLLVEIGKHLSFPLVYRLLKLTLVLPVATATVERCFSAMKF
ncbi:uncharacterized protein LOC111876086 [Lactuca sativa]|uniref:uncharacterized protein LOC111876086 n=1 Tax=Lactuca sativa TaxID=4236 RepID=UPI0022AF5B07|nr:uncharacterized protein LOC111876086 [Lactuca sativa]